MDLLGRGVAQELGDKLGAQFVVDNRAGAAGNIGAMAAAKAPPDGYTILMAGAGSLALNKFMFASMPYDPETELTPIVLVSKLPHIFVVNPKVEARTLKELVEYAKANPGKLNAGVPGIGTTAHVTLAAFMKEAGRPADRGAVPRRAADAHRPGRRPARCRLHAHHQPGAARAGRPAARARGDQRDPHAAIARRSDRAGGGLPGFEAIAWFALAAPTGTPPQIVEKINAAVNAFLRSDKGREDLRKLDSLPAGGTPEETKAFIAGESRKWGPIIKAAGIQM